MRTVYEGNHWRVKGPTVAVLAHDGARFSQVQRLLALAKGPSFICAASAEAYEWLDAPVYADVAAERGEVGALVTALALASTEWVQVVSTRVPFVTAELLDVLWLHRHAHTDAVCLARADGLEPRVGLYRRALVYDWEPRLAGAPTWTSLLDGCRVDEVRWSPAESFSNAPTVATVAGQVTW